MDDIVNDTTEKLGYTSHVEIFSVLLGIGVVLGAIAAIQTRFGFKADQVAEIAIEAISIRIFFLLCWGGLLCGVFAKWEKINHTLRKALSYVFPPILRVGLTIGFGLSAITTGFGVGGTLFSFIMFLPDEAISALRLVVLGLFLLYRKL